MKWVRSSERPAVIFSLTKGKFRTHCHSHGVRELDDTACKHVCSTNGDCCSFNAKEMLSAACEKRHDATTTKNIVRHKPSLGLCTTRQYYPDVRMKKVLKIWGINSLGLLLHQIAEQSWPLASAGKCWWCNLWLTTRTPINATRFRCFFVKAVSTCALSSASRNFNVTSSNNDLSSLSTSVLAAERMGSPHGSACPTCKCRGWHMHPTQNHTIFVFVFYPHTQSPRKTNKEQANLAAYDNVAWCDMHVQQPFSMNELKSCSTRHMHLNVSVHTPKLKLYMSSTSFVPATKCRLKCAKSRWCVAALLLIKCC